MAENPNPTRLPRTVAFWMQSRSRQQTLMDLRLTFQQLQWTELSLRSECDFLRTRITDESAARDFASDKDGRFPLRGSSYPLGNGVYMSDNFRVLSSLERRGLLHGQAARYCGRSDRPGARSRMGEQTADGGNPGTFRVLCEVRESAISIRLRRRCRGDAEQPGSPVFDPGVRWIGRLIIGRRQVFHATKGFHNASRVLI